MAFQITLSEEDYAALVAASTQTGEPIEQLVHEAITARYESPPPTRQIGKYRYPTGEPITDEEEEEMERLAQEIGSQHPSASEIVIEDRGPR
ncbi:MAG TPA: hypothetical protein VFS83_14930 [Ktedonobacterales bacterium]|nr:hypothetical protein [Ktedonobacterales bacterium]